MGFLGGVALLLTVSGIYGVLSYAVSQRTREIGIRVALGAGSRSVVAMVLRQSAQLVAVGAAVGLGTALAVAPLAANQIEVVQPYDWVAYAGTAAVVLGASLVASWAPVRRAVGVDPVRTLRWD
jgi:ABC-type antimicrobial peptide transport system permease subunit